MGTPSHSHKAIGWVLLFFLLAFAITWATGISVVLSNQTALVNGPPEPQLLTLPFPFALLLILIGDYGPAIAAIIIAYALARRKGLGDLIRQVGRWRFNPILYLVALFLTFSINLLAVALFFVFGTLIQGQLFVVPSFIRIGGLIFGPIGEELGFRGFAQPVLQRRYSLLSSSLITGFLWFAWQQWPLFAPASIQGLDLVALAITLVYLVATSIFFAWLYNVTGGSVLIILFAHAGLDLQKGIAPDLFSSTIPYAVSTLLLSLVAIRIALSWRNKQKVRSTQKSLLSSLEFTRNTIGVGE